jgi:hypothetical protein
MVCYHRCIMIDLKPLLPARAPARRRNVARDAEALDLGQPALSLRT